jgi:hypothetical protein
MSRGGCSTTCIATLFDLNSPAASTGESSLALWDDRSTWHFAIDDYQGERRILHRITTRGRR